jgi:hypothetical protein
MIRSGRPPGAHCNWLKRRTCLLPGHSFGTGFIAAEELKKLLPQSGNLHHGMQEARALLGVETPQAAAETLLLAG